MQRIASGSQVASFTAEADVGTPGHFARSADAGGPTQFGKNWPERVQEEICSVIAAASIGLNGADNTQLLQAIRFLATGGLIHAVDTGAANAYVITPSPALGAYIEGLAYSIHFIHANTGASTLNVSALGTKSILREDGTALQAGDIPAGAESIVLYDGSAWRLTAEIPGSATSAAAGIVALATIAQVRAGTDTTHAVTPASLTGSSAWQTLTDASTIAWDVSAGYNAAVTLTASGHTFGAPTNLQDGQTYLLEVTQDATGSRTANWNAIFDFGAAGSPTLTTTAGKTDLFSFVYRASKGKLRATFGLGYS